MGAAGVFTVRPSQHGRTLGLRLQGILSVAEPFHRCWIVGAAEPQFLPSHEVGGHLFAAARAPGVAATLRGRSDELLLDRCEQRGQVLRDVQCLGEICACHIGVGEAGTLEASAVEDGASQMGAIEQ